MATPLERFVAIHAALVAGRTPLDRDTWLRAGALAAIDAADEPSAVAQRVRATADGLFTGAAWFSPLASQLRYLAAGVLVAGGGDHAGFIAEVEALRAALAAAGLPHRGRHEVLAALVLRITGIGRDDAVAAMAELWRGMKRQHRWLTGADDLPACALLAGAGAEPATLLARMDAAWDALHERGVRTGDLLQTASHLLALAGGEPRHLAGRCTLLARRCRGRGIPGWDERAYPAVALLAVGSDDPAALADRLALGVERVWTATRCIFDLPTLHTAALLLARELPGADTRRLQAIAVVLAAGPRN
jgi:hypothetical protein